ncbi:MAG: ligase [Micrococcales bacterium]|nr:ligase [Micrococcales bacterium]
MSRYAAQPAPGPASPAAAKKSLRTLLRARRREIAAARDRAADDAALAAVAGEVVDEAGLVAGDWVTLYEALPHEPPTAGIAAEMARRGVRVLVPITLPDLDLDWCELDDRPLEQREALGHNAIARAGVVFAPGLSVDRGRRRLGQGGGCYDRALPRRSPGVPVIVLLHPGEIAEQDLPVDAHDQRVDGIISAEGREL